MGLSVQWETPGAMLLPTESRQQRQTLTGSLLEEVQEEVLQPWPLSPATCEGTHWNSCSLVEEKCLRKNCCIQKERFDSKCCSEIYFGFGNFLTGLWVQTQVVLLVTLEHCVVLWPWSPLMVCCPDMVSFPWLTPWTSPELWPEVSVMQPSS